MKNTIVVLIVLLLNIPVLAQNDAAVIYPELSHFLQAEKADHGLLPLLNNSQPDYKHFIELYNKQNHAGKSAGTFMDGPAVYSIALPVEVSRNANTLYQRYSAAGTEPSTALQILGLVAGITATAVYPTYSTAPYPYYSGSSGAIRYLDSRAAIEASYLQSTYHQHDR